jgi:hypothetical protein
MAHIWETADARAASKDDESQHYAMACSECQRRKQKVSTPSKTYWAGLIVIFLYEV